MKNILVTHAYSRLNSGDGLLVDETINVVSRAFPNAKITVVASHPDTFAFDNVRIVSSKPRSWRSLKEYCRLLIQIADFDLVVAVGGGYLRARSGLDLVKMSIIHGPQLVATALAPSRSVYMPQSIGPFDKVTSKLVRRLLARIDNVYVRDDRSLSLLGKSIATRSMDLAVMSGELNERTTREVEPKPILSVRKVGRGGDEKIDVLATMIRPFDGLIQSSVSGNNDVEATERIRPETIVDHTADDGRSQRRVVVAVRLHAALMALHQGHYVIHLAYERKGFGAFQDLGLSGFVHNVYDFDPAKVADQCRELLRSENVRQAYDAALNSSRADRETERSRLLSCVETGRGLHA
ncbi:polysaccharide pyruvyl transferase family protein [Rhodococcus pyridinivorans]|uniref:Polysaccharide pyruvyl transferase family protein n=1 Tax=Rhodococcus pyridinivorans TaxID=103816 RepID=A0A7M2XJQ6_9NOCA|nr:polysaccharide pyruvyl transferase family protein [Rhodococcus pyridinivorans]QOV98106.1 polysaccharide pyruvyl transferase family protein [Rhodococcus pyridinivorans]